MKKCLIVVDYQNDFVSGSLGFEKAKTLELGIANKINSYHVNGDDVIFTLDTHYDDYMDSYEGKHLPVPHCKRIRTDISCTAVLPTAFPAKI